MLLENDFKTVIEYAGRRATWITPCKRSAARGNKTIPAPELRRSSTRYGVEGRADSHYPELRYACTGLSTFKTYGLAFLIY